MSLAHNYLSSQRNKILVIKNVIIIPEIVISMETFGNILFRMKSGIAITIDDAKSPIIKNRVGQSHPPESPLAVSTIYT